MTLILSVLTHSYVVQVSDRRLVTQDPASGTIDWHDDETNKAVLWRGRLAFAYSGLAELGEDRRTDIWLAKTLADIPEEARGIAEGRQPDQGFLLERLAERCTEEFRRPRIQSLPQEMRRQSFVAVGWAHFTGEADFSPYLACVSNVYAPGDFAQLQEPADEFTLWWRRLEVSEGGFFHSEGQRLGEDEQSAVVERLGALDAAFPGPYAVIEALIEVLREEAEVPESRVGRGVLVNVLPRASVVAGASGRFISLGPPVRDQQTFLYLPSGEAPPGVAYGPHFVGEGVVMSDFIVTDTAEDS